MHTDGLIEWRRGLPWIVWSDGTETPPVAGGDGEEDEVTFDERQQDKLNELIGEARRAARSEAKAEAAKALGRAEAEWEAKVQTAQEKAEAAAAALEEAKAKGKGTAGMTEEAVAAKIEETVKQLRDQHQAELTEVATDRDTKAKWLADMEAQAIEAAIIAAASAEETKSISPQVMAIHPRVRQHVGAVRGDDGRVRVAVLDEDGKPRTRIDKDGKTVPVSLGDVLKEAYAEFPELAAGKPIVGAGTTGANGAGRGPKTINDLIESGMKKHVTNL